MLQFQIIYNYREIQNQGWHVKNKNIGYSVIVMASVIIILAGIKSASEIIVPFLLSLF